MPISSFAGNARLPANRIELRPTFMVGWFLRAPHEIIQIPPAGLSEGLANNTAFGCALLIRIDHDSSLSCFAAVATLWSDST
jgi:hypothetical protein